MRTALRPSRRQRPSQAAMLLGLAGYRCRDVADRMGVTEWAVAQWLRGRDRAPERLGFVLAEMVGATRAAAIVDAIPPREPRRIEQHPKPAA